MLSQAWVNGCRAGRLLIAGSKIRQAQKKGKAPLKPHPATPGGAPPEIHLTKIFHCKIPYLPAHC
ncbi:hypothetical protein C0V77_10665 [Emticicia sp. TH156]|nr:hypothetical protein C0V77_10665 [Emticicia sp. TH156]